MERLGADDRVDRRVGERQTLGFAGERLDVWMGGDEFGAHRRDRLDGDEPRAGRAEQRRELAGAGAEIDDDATRREVEFVAQPIGERGGIVGPRTLIGLGGGAETLRGGVMNGRTVDHAILVNATRLREQKPRGEGQVNRMRQAAPNTSEPSCRPLGGRHTAAARRKS